MAPPKKKSKVQQDHPEYAHHLQRVFGVATPEALDKASYHFDEAQTFDAENFWKTGVLSWDLICGGYGQPKTGLTHLWCENAIGKTTMLAAVCRSAIFYSGVKVWWGGFEPAESLLTDMGLIGRSPKVKPEQFRYFPEVRYYRDLEWLMKAFVASDADILVLDSLTSVVRSPETFAEAGSLEKATVGTKARIETEFLSNFHAWLLDVGKSCIYITQARNKIATKPWQKSGLDAAGSEASKFFSSLRISMRGATSLVSKDVGYEEEPKRVGTTGFIFAETKNRFARPMVKIPVWILFGTGVSNLSSMRDFLLWEGTRLQQAGAWYTSTLGGQETRANGTTALFNILRDHQIEILELFYSGKNTEYFSYLESKSLFKDE